MQYLLNIANSVLQKAVVTTIVNGYFAAKRFFTGEVTAKTAAAETAEKVAKETGFELARAGLEQAAALIPGGAIVQGMAKASANMTAQGFRAGLEGRNIATTVAKNACYAASGAIAGPLLAMPLGFATDYLVDTTANKIDFAYQNFTNGRDFKALNKQDYISSLICENVKLTDLNESFVLLSPKDESIVLVSPKAAPAA